MGKDSLDRRPAGVDDATVDAVGKLSEALRPSNARGALYTFHQLMGHADLQAGEASEQLRAAGHGDIADRLDTDLVGRNVLPGRWTFQVVEEFDEGTGRCSATTSGPCATTSCRASRTSSRRR